MLIFKHTFGKHTKLGENVAHLEDLTCGRNNGETYWQHQLSAYVENGGRGALYKEINFKI